MIHTDLLRQVLVVGFLSLAVAAGCGGDDDDSTPAPAGSGGSGGGSAGGEGGGSVGGEGGSVGGEGGGSGLEGACTNDTDMAAIQATYGSENKTVSQVASSCGVACVSDADPETCSDDCILSETANAVSGECVNCYTKSALCAKDNCLAECISDPEAEACIACRCGGNTAGINCADDVFTGCSGVPTATCQ